MSSNPWCVLQPFEEAAYLAFSRRESSAGSAEQAAAKRAAVLAVAVRSVTIVGEARKHCPAPTELVPSIGRYHIGAAQGACPLRPAQPQHVSLHTCPCPSRLLDDFCHTAGLLAVAFGPAYSYLLLRVAYGQRWSDTGAPAALAAYCPYILLLAANGILEAFVHAVASARRAAPIHTTLALYVTSPTLSATYDADAP